jgi:hypothetical protein
MKSGDGSDSSDDEPLIRHFLRQPELTTVGTSGERVGGGADLSTSVITSTYKRVRGETTLKMSATALVPIKKARTRSGQKGGLRCPSHEGGDEVGLSGCGSSRGSAYLGAYFNSHLTTA